VFRGAFEDLFMRQEIRSRGGYRMRIGLFEGSGAGRGIRPGVVTGEGIVDVSAATARLVAHSPQHLMAQIIDNFEDLRPAFERLAARRSFACGVKRRRAANSNPRTAGRTGCRRTGKVVR
jgi:hypothetical protein